MRSPLRLTMALVIAGAAAPLSAQTPPAGHPNILLIVTDDVGYGDFGSYGAPDIHTPNIDTLARDGTKLTDFYASPQCTPTRVALMTGRYQQRYRLERALPSPRTLAAADSTGSGRGLPAMGYSLPQLLRNSGYATGLIGKWHLGYDAASSPNAHGFDQFFGFKSGYIDYYQHTNSDGDHDLYKNTAPVQVTGYMTDLITERAVTFLQRHATVPFFLEVTYNAAHWPFQVPDHPSVARNHAQFLQPTDDDTSTRADYIQIVERADRGVGQLLETLGRLGLEGNTLVIFTNDNGGEWLSRNAPLFHRKDTLWEGGIRVPAILRWPGHVPANQASSQVGIVMDLTATILAAAGATVPAGTMLEGTDLLPLLQRDAPPLDRTLFFRIAASMRRQLAVQSGQWKLLVDGDDTLLFNLKEDIGERRDVAGQHPDVARRLLPLLRQWEVDVDAEAKIREVMPGPR